jgi:hypothetical protein
MLPTAHADHRWIVGLGSLALIAGLFYVGCPAIVWYAAASGLVVQRVSTK